MRLAEGIIKQAILHQEQEIRLTALEYFAKSFSQDATVMPLVIEAVEAYGQENALRILRDAERLPQTPKTVGWLADQLRRDFDVANLAEDNYRFALALVLCHAQPDLLLQQRIEPDQLPAFPSELRRMFADRLEMHSWDWETGWQALAGIGQDIIRKDKITDEHIDDAEQIVESLGRHTERSDTALALLEESCCGQDPGVFEAIQPFLVELVGELRVDAAGPLLVELLREDDDLAITDPCLQALRKIGTDAVVEDLADDWHEGDVEFRASVAEVLESIHSDLSAQKCLEFLAVEGDACVQLFLGNALLGQFAEEGIEPVRQLVQGDEEDLDREQLDLRYRLVATSTIMGATFPEYDGWYEAALANNWGWGDYQPERLADAFRQGGVGPIVSQNGKAN